ncbi:MAG: diphosphomevalonate decarboxylase [Polyangiales bacterium]
MIATALAHPNIALAKYWGKRDVPGNVPATPSVSLTLDGLSTTTTVRFDDALTSDAFTLGARPIDGEPLTRVARLLDEVRALARLEAFAQVDSVNDFPTASGLASSASGFAALAVAASLAAGLDLDEATVSRIARRASASAARSIFGGFVALGTEDDATARELVEAHGWDVVIVVAAVGDGAKDVASTDGMKHTRTTSPFYDAWTADAPKLARAVGEAIDARDLEALGAATEASAMRMHACAMASDPALIYWLPRTLELIAEVRAMRRDGIGAWATIDAGPHVKVLCAGPDAAAIAARLAPHSARTIVARPGRGARRIDGPNEASR